MTKRVRYIPTLQEYAKKRKIRQARFLDLNNCTDCDYFRDDLNVCIYGSNVKILNSLKACPVTQRAL